MEVLGDFLLVDTDDPVLVKLPSQQLTPTILLCILQVQLFDLLRLHFRQSNWILEGSLSPPQENGVIWSYSKFKELPQQRHAPPSLA
jgi:hypothetical protein